MLPLWLNTVVGDTLGHLDELQSSWGSYSVFFFEAMTSHNQILQVVSVTVGHTGTIDKMLVLYCFLTRYVYCDGDLLFV